MARRIMKQLQTIHLPICLAGSVCLDFTNTAEFRGSDRYVEFLNAYEAVLAWCWRNGVLSDRQAESLCQRAAQQPAEAATALEATLRLRETIYHVFEAVTAGNQPAADDLELFNQTLHAALSHRHLQIDTSRIVWEWADDEAWMRPLWPVVLAAAELLTSEQVSQVRKCPNCGWLFLDTSRNHSRRWCSMDICGSEVKSRRQYERKRAAILK